MHFFHVMVSDICSALAPQTVGSKVGAYRQTDFWAVLHDAIQKHDWPKNGQAKILLPPIANLLVTAGVARRVGLREHDFVVREFRGKMGLYAKREFAAETESVYAIVYTAAAYLADPDITEAEAARVNAQRATHILVAVLANAGPEAPYGSRVLVHNMAGGNNEFLPKTSSADIRAGAVRMIDGGRVDQFVEDIEHDVAMLHRWIELARASEKYEMEWVGVAD